MALKFRNEAKLRFQPFFQPSFLPNLGLLGPVFVKQISPKGLTCGGYRACSNSNVELERDTWKFEGWGCDVLLLAVAL